MQWIQEENELQQNISEKVTMIQSLNIASTAPSSCENQVKLASSQQVDNLLSFMVRLQQTKKFSKTSLYDDLNMSTDDTHFSPKKIQTNIT